MRFPCLLLGGAAWSPPSFWVVLLFFLLLLVGCSFVTSSFVPSLGGVAVLLLLLLGGAALSPPPFGGVAAFPSPVWCGAAFLLLLWVGLLFPMSSVGWCCLVSSFLLGGVAVLPSPFGGVLLRYFFLRSLFGGVAALLLLFGGAAFLLLLWVGLLFPMSSDGWSCLVSFSFWWCGAVSGRVRGGSRTGFPNAESTWSVSTSENVNNNLLFNFRCSPKAIPTLSASDLTKCQQQLII